MRRSLILTVGLPRSGKSTWSKEYIAKYPGAAIVNPDSIRLALHGEPHIDKAEPMVWTMAKYFVESLFLAGHDTVIVDATNITKARRNFWRFGTWDLKFKHIDTSKLVCIQRATDERRNDLIPVIRKMADRFEPLEGIEEFSRI